MPTDQDGRAPDYLASLSRVMGLAIACPYSQDNPGHCQLCDVRNLPLADRIEWVRGLSSAELKRIAIGHEACLKALEAEAGDGGQ